MVDIQSEFDEWSRPEMFREIRKDRDVNGPSEVFSLSERLRTLLRVVRRFGIRGVRTALESEKIFYRAVMGGELGYCLYWSRRA